MRCRVVRMLLTGPWWSSSAPDSTTPAKKRAEQRHTDLRQQASKEAGQEERCVSAVSLVLRLVDAS